MCKNMNLNLENVKRLLMDYFDGTGYTYLY